MSTKAVAEIARRSAFMDTLKRWAFRKSGYNQYGLYHDDLLYQTEDVKEAIRRLPDKIVDERNFRMVRAAQLSIQKTILPEKEWVTYEQDHGNRYLTPIVEQVKKEREEREKWISTH